MTPSEAQTIPDPAGIATAIHHRPNVHHFIFDRIKDREGK